jgi:hypothetical protein
MQIIIRIYRTATAELGEDKHRISKQFNIPQKSNFPALQGLQEFYHKS